MTDFLPALELSHPYGARMTESSLTERPLLTVAIPTYNRAFYLEQNLAQLRSGLSGVVPGLVEVIVSDNCSPDTTPHVVGRAIRRRSWR